MRPTALAPSPVAAPKKGMGVGSIIALVAVVAVLLGVGILVVVARTLSKTYIREAKTAEAKNSLGQMSKDAITAYEESVSAGGKRHLCASATSPVPKDMSSVRGRKYQSSEADWQEDRGSNAGFACLKFEMTSPQYFQYAYEATSTGFVGTGRGDLNGDGLITAFEVRGEVVDDRLVVRPTILETSR